MSHGNPKLPKNNSVHGDSKMPTPTLTEDSEQWHKERRELLAMEKDVLRQYDAMLLKRRQLSWLRVTKDYLFTDVDGKQVSFLKDLVPPRPTGEGGENPLPLVVQHFMWPEGWDKACGNCSVWADGLDGIGAQISKRTRLIIVMNPPSLEKMKDFASVKNWANTEVYSCAGTDFGKDLVVSQSQADIDAKVPMQYNFSSDPKALNPFGCTELPGYSVFSRAPASASTSDHVYRTYSLYARGMEPLSSYWSLLDILPGGRLGQFGVEHKEDILAEKKKRMEERK